MTTSHSTAPTIDEAKVDQFTHQLIGDLAAALSAVLIHIGDRLGLYRALADSVPVTSGRARRKTGLAERYLREWLHNQAAAGWVTYQPEDATFTLPAEHALLLADENSPTFMLGGFDFVSAAWADEKTAHRCVPHRRQASAGTNTTSGCSPAPNASSDRATRPTSSAWLPALDGVVRATGARHHRRRCRLRISVRRPSCSARPTRTAPS